MGKGFFKRAGLASMALALLLALPLPLMSTPDVVALSADGNSWSEYVAGDRTYCDAGAASLFVAICSEAAPQLLGTEPNNASGVVTVTMHVNDGEGYFEGEADPLVHPKDFYFRDGFDDYTEPVSTRADYVFAGWSKSPAATTVDVVVGGDRAGSVGTDLYAVWSNKAYVYYHTPGGVWEDPDSGELYQHILMEYDAGSHFQYLDPNPQPLEGNIYNFVGWYEKMSGEGTEYTPATIIDTLITDVYSAWNYNAGNIDAMELDVKYDFTSGVSVPVFAFTAPETAVYEVYTEGIVSPEEDALQGMVRIRNIFDYGLAMESQMDPSTGWGDVHTYYEMQAGETYYIRVGEAGGKFLSAKLAVRKPTMVNITFHANEASAYFDGDPAKTTKNVAFPVGYDIRTKFVDGLEYDTENMAFGRWETENDDGHSWLLVTEDTTDLYAEYVEMISVYLDYNGGYDPFTEEPNTVAKFIPGYCFETPIDPVVDNPALSFVGWSRNPAATEPDADITEGLTGAEAFHGQTFYAVYGEKVPVTFVTEYGGYMADDPNVTVYETSLAAGHVFYGMAVMHANENVKHTGWIDQNGERLYETSDVDGNYHISGETTFTAVLEYRLTAFANGGVFPNGGIGGAEILGVQVPYGGGATTFSTDEVLDRTGTPVSYDASKHFVGFATTADATEPDIIDGVTPVEDLNYIYVVWGENDPDEPDTPEDPVIPGAPNTGAGPR